MDDQVLRAKPAQPAARASGAAWDRGLLLASVELLLVAIALVLFWPTTLTLVGKWQVTSNSAYGHGFLIFGISMWLLARNRFRLQPLSVRPSPAGALLLVLVSCVWLVALRAGIQTGHQLLLPVIIGLAFWAALGRQIAFYSLFPLGYLYFALPIWDSANGLLQSATVVASEFLLRLSAVHAYFEGNFVHLASGVFEIAGGCSGMHFFIVALALAALYGEINNDSLKLRAKLLLLAAALALVMNWIRVYTIILAGYLTDMQHYLVHVDHYKYGWVLFTVAMTIFFLIARRLPASSASEPTALGDHSTSVGVLMRGVPIAALALAFAPAWNLLAPLRAAPEPAPDALLPRSVSSWAGPQASVSDWKPVFAGAQLTAMGDYVNDSRRVSLYTAVYLLQEQGKELVGYHNALVGADVEVVSTKRIDSPLPMNETVVQTATGSDLIRYFYQVADFTTNRGVLAELVYGVRSLVGQPLSRFVALRTACLVDCDSARATLDDLAGALDISALNSPEPRDAAND